MEGGHDSHADKGSTRLEGPNSFRRSTEIRSSAGLLPLGSEEQ